MIQFDTETGRLRLGGLHLDALLRGLDSPFGPDPSELDAAAVQALDAAWTELVAAQVVEPSGVPAPAIESWAAVLVQPWAVVQVQAIGPAGSEAHQVWIAPGLGIAAAQVADGWYDLIPVTPEGVPAALVRLGRLGPRGHVDERSHRLPEAVFDGLFDDTGAAGAAALAAALDPAWPSVGRQVRAGDWRIVQFHTAWAPGLFPTPEQAEEAGRALMVLDTTAGCLSIVPGDPVDLHAVTPTDLWEILIGMTLPPDSLTEGSSPPRLLG
jgi:hypothetical protein